MRLMIAAMVVLMTACGGGIDTIDERPPVVDTPEAKKDGKENDASGAHCCYPQPCVCPPKYPG
jgi:hypothetical protein